MCLNLQTVSAGGESARPPSVRITLEPKREQGAMRNPSANGTGRSPSTAEAAAAVLQSGRGRAVCRLTVAYPGTTVRTELICRGRLLWSGPWELEVRCDGLPAQPCSDWKEVCRVCDDDVDYLELEIHLTGRLRVQRQMLLARQDRFLLLADAVLGTAPAELEYRGGIALGRGVGFRGSRQTREGFLVDDGRRALVMPLALPEWRTDPRAGTLCRTDRGLELHQSAQGRCLLAPLWLDLDPRRMVRPRTWRRLTVAENLAVLPDDVAVGYRVMADRQQWLVYRALACRGSRTLLGRHLLTETLVARFRRDGETESLVEIE
jgi:hypothetical protein